MIIFVQVAVALSLIPVPAVISSACTRSAQQFENSGDEDQQRIISGIPPQNRTGSDYLPDSLLTGSDSGSGSGSGSGPGPGSSTGSPFSEGGKPLKTKCVFQSTCSPYVNDPNWKYNGTCAKCQVTPSNRSTLSQAIIEAFKSVVPEACLREIHVLDINCRRAAVPPRWPTFINFSEFNEVLTGLQSLTVSGCSLTKAGLQGSLSRNIVNLNLSNNALEALPNALFMRNATTEGDGHSTSKMKLKLSFVVLSNNPYLKLLPITLLNLTTIRSIWLGSNNFPCSWVGNKLFSWYEKNYRIFADAQDLDCKHTPEDATLSIQRITVFGALKAKHDEKTECRRMSCPCKIYTVQKTETFLPKNFPVSFISHGENMSITLQVNCSYQNLTQLPNISPITKFLNVSHNRITNLEKLHTSDYNHLGSLIAEYNQIQNIDTLKNTDFIKRFDVLGLKHNNISSLPSKLMSVILDNGVKGHGRVSLGQNYIDCNCDTADNIKNLLIIHMKKIADGNEIYCNNFVGVRVKDLEYYKVCDRPDENEVNTWWYLVITLEVCLIVGVMGKVWHDSRQYRLTGILPWFSAKMPRLPCDFILEGFKGPLNNANPNIERL